MTETALLRAEESSLLIEFLAKWLGEEGASFRKKCPFADQVEVCWGEQITVKRSDKILSVTLPDMAHGLTLELPLKNQRYETKCYALIVYLFAFPFTTESQFHMLDDVSGFLNRKPDASQRFWIIMFRNVRTGFSDFMSPEGAVHESRGKILKWLNENDLGNVVDVMPEPMDFWKMFKGADKSFRQLLKKEKSNYRRNYEDGLENLKLDYEIKIGTIFTSELGSDKLDAFMAYQVVKNSKDVVKSYVTSFFESEQWITIRKNACALFQDNVEPICFWDIKKDTYAFSEKLSSYCAQILLKKGYPVVSCVSELDYNKKRAEKHAGNTCDVYFQERIKDLENALFSFISNEIENRWKLVLEPEK